MRVRFSAQQTTSLLSGVKAMPRLFQSVKSPFLGGMFGRECFNCAPLATSRISTPQLTKQAEATSLPSGLKTVLAITLPVVWLFELFIEDFIAGHTAICLPSTRLHNSS